MTYLWDTHAVIWAMEDDPLLSERARAAAEERNENAVSGITLWEVAALVNKGRIKLSIPLDEWLDELTSRLPVFNISGAIAARCYNLGPFHGDPADRIIVATALIHSLTIVTRDQKIHAYQKVASLWD
ncbi:MAG: type II toxin-antitoxin system VapC family toxin [Verrucomicrobia bacterium]|nr:type II toxin-antitoxin system VapC family toxin [Verrucomicrobiota bacterium]